MKESKEIVLYHGSENIIERPQFGIGNKYNDYGLGFYTTPVRALAAEWAVPKDDVDGYVNAYRLNLEGLKILDLDEEPFEHWISILIQNRKGRYAEAAMERQQKWLAKFPFSIEGYDVVKGWRADDSYFSFVRDFFDVGLSLENLTTAMKLGGLGVQYCLVTEESINRLEFIHPPELIQGTTFYAKRQSRDNEARNAYRAMRNKARGTTIYHMVGED